MVWLKTLKWDDEMTIREGFWNDEQNRYPEFPMPEHSDVEFDDKFDILDKLHMIQMLTSSVFYAKGFSICRCCGVPNGSMQYEACGYTWPEGFEHYIQDHNVRPSNDFITKVLNLKV